MKDKHPLKALLLVCALTATLTAGCGSASSASEASKMTRLKNVTGSSESASVLSDSASESDSTDEPWSVDTAKEELTKILASDLEDKSAVLDVPEMLQNPELPTGCESVALTIALNALGCNLNKTDIADQFLEYGDNLAYQYAGDPHTDSGAGVFAAGIINAAEKYIEEQNLEIAAFNTSGTSLDDLYKVVDAGYPVVIWGTMYMSEPLLTEQTYEYNGTTYTWYRNEHCMVLCGYDKDSGTVVVSDPLSGIVVRDASQFESYFDEIGQYSVVLMNEDGIQKTSLDTSKPDTGNSSVNSSSTENYHNILDRRQDTSSYYYNQWQNNGNSTGTYYSDYSSQEQSYDAPAGSGSGTGQGNTGSSSSGNGQAGSGTENSQSGSGSSGNQSTDQSGSNNAQGNNSANGNQQSGDTPGTSDTPSNDEGGATNSNGGATDNGGGTTDAGSGTSSGTDSAGDNAQASGGTASDTGASGE